MKKFLILILTFAYIASTSGATVYLHYCMGKMVEWNVVENDKAMCANCGMDKSEKDSDKCCKDEHKQLKVTNDHNVVETALKGMQLLAFAMPVSYIEMPDVHFSSTMEENPTGNAPPGSYSIPIYKRNCIFRI